MHCIIPGGGVTKAGNWKTTRNNGKFLYPVKALSKVFRARYVAGLRKAFPKEAKDFYDGLFSTNWVVYAKRPFGGPLQVVEYLGRYTHKIAISNHRIQDVSGDVVSFAYKDYRDAAANKTMQLTGLEFIRRFAMHILPKGFVRIRHYGILSGQVKQTALPQIRQQLQHQQELMVQNSEPPVVQAPAAMPCPCCKKGIMLRILDFDHRGPPSQLLQRIMQMGTAINAAEKKAV